MIDDPIFQQTRLALQQGRYGAAIQGARRLVESSGGAFEALMLLADVHGKVGQLEEEIDVVRRAVAKRPDDPRVHLHLGRRLRVVGALDEARSSFERALELAPGTPPALVGLAHVHETAGRHDEARAIVDPLVASAPSPMPPELSAIHARLLLHAGAHEEAVALAESVARAGHRPSLPVRATLLTGARAAERAEDYDTALDLAARAHALMPAPFDAGQHVANADRLLDLFPRDAVAAMPRANVDGAPCVFIVGLPRSGSTLVERIVHAHPDAHGAGESTLFFHALNGIQPTTGGTTPFPACALELDAPGATTIGEAFLVAFRHLAPLATRITNKHLAHFEHLPMIAQLLPGARVVHCRRDPMDTLLSCHLSSLQPAQAPWAGTFENLAAHAAFQRRVMAGWADRVDVPIHTVEYEALVTDQDAETRRLLDFLDLPFDDACLRPHEVERLDGTLSADQVRRPVDRTAMGRAARYGARLDPLREALGRYGVE